MQTMSISSFLMNWIRTIFHRPRSILLIFDYAKRKFWNGLLSLFYECVNARKGKIHTKHTTDRIKCYVCWCMMFIQNMLCAFFIYCVSFSDFYERRPINWSTTFCCVFTIHKCASVVECWLFAVVSLAQRR